jgi:protein-disulfide isomerase
VLRTPADAPPAARVSNLGSAPVPAPSAADHRRGPADAPLVIVYADFECPFCATLHKRLSDAPVLVVFRHFPVRSSHPRAWAAACAAEAAARQGHFWGMHDRLFADQARLEDPHLWQRARELGMELERFDADRRAPDTLARVKRDFQSGVRGGVVTTPEAFAWRDGGAHRIDPRTLAGLDLGSPAPTPSP